ncbi:MULTISPECIES: trigger factor [Fusobacterium]|uniref:trigger factor n=1 Tax=Fusobacterium TaxID=848 RepID=UPI0014774D75|nr:MULTISPECIES: trigger factor [Fusobacterium]NME36228.1 trigger factor [Fusobacterium sp. FSA-380-WT-3A]
MKYEIKKLEKSALEVTMTLTKEEYNPIEGAVLTKAQKDVEIPGFRKGHAPLEQIKAKYAKETEDQVCDEIIKKFFGEVIKNENLKPVSPLYNGSLKVQEEATLIVHVDVFPEFELGQYKGLEAEKVEFQMTDERLDTEIQNILKRKSTLTDYEAGHKAQMGDTVELSFEGFIDGVPFEGGKADTHMLELGSHSFIDTFEDQLVGYEIGQEGEVNVTFPEQYHSKELAGKPAVFKVKVKAIKFDKVPELNDEFAKTLGYESVEDMKAKTREDVEKRETENAKNQYRAALLKKVVEGTNFEVPRSLVYREVEGRLAELEQQLMAQGMDLKSYLSMTGMTHEAIFNQLAPMSESKVKMDIILDKIAETEKIEATEEEFNNKMEDIAKMYGMTAESLKEELVKNKNFENFEINVKNEIILNKAIDFIVANAK